MEIPCNAFSISLFLTLIILVRKFHLFWLFGLWFVCLSFQGINSSSHWFLHILFLDHWLQPWFWLSSCLFFLGDIATYFSKAFRCIIKLLVQALSNFWYKHLVLFNFLRIALIMSHKFLAFLLFIQFPDF